MVLSTRLSSNTVTNTIRPVEPFSGEKVDVLENSEYLTKKVGISQKVDISRKNIMPQMPT